MKLAGRMWLLAFMLIVLAVNVSAIGLSPARTSVEFKPGYEGNMKLTVINSEMRDQNLLVYADGELAKYITFEKQQFSVKADEPTTELRFNVKLPEKVDRQGTFKSKIFVTVVPDEAADNVIQVAASVATEFVMTVPYEGKYIEVTPFIMSEHASEPPKFTVAIRNLGTEDINAISSFIELFDAQGTKLEEMKTAEIGLKAKNEGKLEAVSRTVYPVGTYTAKIFTEYDGFMLEETVTFAVGSMNVKILSVSSERFTLGQINKLDVLVQNTWNAELKDVFAEGTITDEQNKVKGSFKTASADLLPQQISPLSAFWDTGNVMPGFYTLDLVVNYANKVSTKSFELEVSTNSLKTNVDLTGRVVDSQSPGSSDFQKNLLILLVMVLIIVNVLVVIYFKSRKKGEKKK